MIYWCYMYWMMLVFMGECIVIGVLILLGLSYFFICYMIGVDDYCLLVGIGVVMVSFVVDFLV